MSLDYLVDITPSIIKYHKPLNKPLEAYPNNEFLSGVLLERETYLGGGELISKLDISAKVDLKKQHNFLDQKGTKRPCHKQNLLVSIDFFIVNMTIAFLFPFCLQSNEVMHHSYCPERAS